ncbi:MAG: hypothetical protein WKG07_24550 [Hymenobacter sp.]
MTVNGDTQPRSRRNRGADPDQPRHWGNSVGSPGSHTLTITNDDGPAPTVAFASGSGTISRRQRRHQHLHRALSCSPAGCPGGGFTVPVSVDVANSTASSPSRLRAEHDQRDLRAARFRRRACPSPSR